MFAYPISIGIDPCDTKVWLQIICDADINFRYLHTRHGFAYSSLSELRKFKQLSKEKKDPGKCIARSEWHRFAFLQTQIQIWMYKHLFLHRKLSFSKTLCSCSVSTSTCLSLSFVVILIVIVKFNCTHAPELVHSPNNTTVPIIYTAQSFPFYCCTENKKHQRLF